MKTTLNQQDNKLFIVIEGDLDTLTARDFEKEVGTLDEAVEEVEIDLTNLDYLASSGIRVLVKILKEINKRKGSVTLLHPNDFVMDVFETTGLVDIFEIVE